MWVISMDKCAMSHLSTINVWITMGDSGFTHRLLVQLLRGRHFQPPSGAPDDDLSPLKIKTVFKKEFYNSDVAPIRSDRSGLHYLSRL